MDFESTPTIINKKIRILTFLLTTPIDDHRPIYITGTFNDWKIDDEKYKMTKTETGQYSFTFSDESVLTEKFEYKYIRGGWENVELDEFGNHTLNRLAFQPFEKIHDYVPRWRNYGLEFAPFYLPRIQLVSDNFYIPQLKKHRKIWALLPHNYSETNKFYPVLYLQDAQNLFHDQGPFGSWRIDRKLAALAEVGKGELIVIAIDHGHTERADEFLPITLDKDKKANGRHYIKFINNTLKPYIDINFRTLKDRANTGIGGSSMGGLISMYAGLMFPETFGRLMIFSPSFWAVKNIPFNFIKFFNPIATKIYLYAGAMESKDMVEHLNHFKDSIEKQGFNHNYVQFKTSIEPKGTHNEHSWGNEFPKAIDWLFNY